MHSIKTNSVKKYLCMYSWFILSTIAGITCAIVIARYYNQKNIALKSAKKKAISINKHAAQSIAERLSLMTSTVDTIAQELSTGTVSYEKIIARLSQRSPLINALGVAFAPYAYNKTAKSYAPYIVNEGEKQKILFLEKIYDYTQKGSERHPILEQNKFKDPFRDPATKNTVIEYATPFFDENHNPIGIVFGNYSLEQMQQLVASLYPSSIGHGSIASKSGLYITDPMSELVEQKKTVPQVGKEYVGPWLGKELDRAIKGEIDFIEEKPDWISTQISWIIFEPIPSTAWYVYGVFLVDELIEDPITLNRMLIDAVLSFILFLSLLTCTLIGLYTRSQKKYWLRSATISLGIITGTAFLWNNTATKIPFSRSTHIIEQGSFNIDATIQALSNNPNTPLTSMQKKPANIIKIPTGVYIHQLAVDIDKIMINAYIWQQIPINSPEPVHPGLIFPQATQISMKQLPSFTEGNTKTVAWSAHCTLEQNFDYSKYPFDFRHITITLWPSTFDNSTILTPDLDGYAIMSPLTLPGISSQVNIESNWQFYLSYFAYKKAQVPVTFGYSGVKNKLPELTFNTIAGHHSVGILMLNLTPVIVILMLLFILLVMAPYMEFSSIFGTATSLFFTGLISYTAFKASLPIQQIVFFDFLYFMLQITTIIIPIMIVGYYSKLNIALIKYEHMLIPQLAFWPLMSSAILIISLFFFY